MWHQGTTFPSAARLKWGLPLQLEDIAMDFPDLKMIIAHLGHPWEADAIVLIRKCPNVYVDISAVHYRPYRYWQAMVTAMEYGVEHKVLPGSDFPSATLDNVIAGLRNINQHRGGYAVSAGSSGGSGHDSLRELEGFLSKVDRGCGSLPSHKLRRLSR